MKELLQNGALHVQRLYEHHWDEHDGLSKDDRHHVSRKELQRNVLTRTTKLILATFNAFSVLYWNFTYRFYQKNGESHHKDKSNNLSEELDETTTFCSGES